MVALRSSSNSTTCLALSSSSAISTMPTAPSTISGARGDDGVRLLPAQHHAGDFRRVGEVRDARLDHLHAGIGHALLNFVAQLVGDFVDRHAQRHLAFQVGVVGIRGGQRAHRAFALHVDVVFVVVDVEDGFGGLDHAPDDHGGDLDRVAVLVVDLELAAFEIAHAQRDAAPAR